MKRISASLLALCVAATAACSDDPATTETPCCTVGEPALRVVNAFTSPVDVLVDGAVAVSALPAGAIDTASVPSGNHTVVLRATGSSSGSTQSIATGGGALRTIAVVRTANGSVGAAALDDTNSVVAAGATKVRVLHLAPNAGTLQVYRTQPDFQQQPVSWQFPFTYQAEPTSLSAPFYQSTPGTWEIRVWQAPADASGWGSATTRVLIPLAGGEKRTLLILDAPGGGLRTQLL